MELPNIYVHSILKINIIEVFKVDFALEYSHIIRLPELHGVST